MVSTLDRFISEQVQPAAARWFGQPVVEIKQISAYSCRGMNGDPRANISEHAFGNALDIAAFTLADGHRITVKDGWHGAPEEQGFLHDVQGAACEMFATVLAPGSNEYHYDHMHVDLMRRASGRIICQPAAISGEAAAARAGGRYGWRPGAPSVTGSIASARRPAYRSPPDQPYSDDHDGRRPRGGRGGLAVRNQRARHPWHADHFDFRFRGAWRGAPGLRGRGAVGGIELCEIGGEFVTQGKLVGRKVPAGVGEAAALHFQSEGRRPGESLAACSATVSSSRMERSRLGGDLERCPWPGHRPRRSSFSADREHADAA